MPSDQSILFTCAVCSVKHKPDGNKKNPDGSQKLLTCAQEGTSYEFVSLTEADGRAIREHRVHSPDRLPAAVRLSVDVDPYSFL